MKVFIAHMVTDSSGHYYRAFKKKPTKDQLYKGIWIAEGKIQTLYWYQETTSITIKELEIETGSQPATKETK